MSTNELILEVAQIASTTVINCIGLWVLAWYRVHRKWIKAEPTTIMGRCGKYWVEIVITVVVVPQWPDAIRAGLKLFAGG